MKKALRTVKEIGTALLMISLLMFVALLAPVMMGVYGMALSVGAVIMAAVIIQDEIIDRQDWN